MKKKRRNFSSFNIAEAYKELGLTKLIEWKLEAPPVAPSEYYYERMRRVRDKFDLTSAQRGKLLLIDAVCEEALDGSPNLKIWKEATIQSDEWMGLADYVAAPNRDYLDTPLLCIVEAKKDDFEQGLAQCLVEMKACQWSNAQVGSVIDVYGVVTNGEGWKFYRLATDGQVFESRLYSLGEIDEILGSLRMIFTNCDANSAVFAQAA